MLAAREGLTRKKRHLQRKNDPKMVPNLTVEISAPGKMVKKAINGFVASF